VRFRQHAARHLYRETLQLNVTDNVSVEPCVAKTPHAMERAARGGWVRLAD
jgi:hypothetical protein